MRERLLYPSHCFWFLDARKNGARYPVHCHFGRCLTGDKPLVTPDGVKKIWLVHHC